MTSKKISPLKTGSLTVLLPGMYSGRCQILKNDLVQIQKKHILLRYKIAYKYEHYVIYGLK